MKNKKVILCNTARIYVGLTKNDKGYNFVDTRRVISLGKPNNCEYVIEIREMRMKVL